MSSFDDESSLADVGSLRPGDMFRAPSGWQPVREVYTGADGLVCVVTDRTTGTVPHKYDPGARVPVRRADLRHPNWCDERFCRAFDAAAIWPEHKSTERLVANKPGTLHIALWLSKDADEPVDDVPGSTVVRLELSTDRAEGGFSLPIQIDCEMDPEQARDLVRVVGELLDALEGHCDGTEVGR